jgi:dethiobiotin synthetase
MTTALPDVFFITGTDTDVGKTFISAVLMLGLNAAYWKPIQSGDQPATDTQWIMTATRLPSYRFLPETYVFSQPLSPHAAAIIDGVTIETSRLRQDFSDHRKLLQNSGVGPQRPRLIVEGAGGLMVPLTENVLVVDLIDQLHLPVLLVCRSTLGTINHTLLTIEQLRAHHIPLLGVVMNGPRNDSNKQSIEHFGKARVIAQVEPVERADAETLRDIFDREFRNAIDVGDESDRLASLHANANRPEAT